jgi:hypothetical protein
MRFILMQAKDSFQSGNFSFFIQQELIYYDE